MRVSNNSDVIEWIHPVNETKMETYVNELQYWAFKVSSKIERSELHERIFFDFSIEKVAVCPSHQRQNIWYYHDIILPLQITGRRLISIRSMIRTGPRASAEVFVIQPKNDVCNRLVHQVGGHLAATADLFGKKGLACLYAPFLQNWAESVALNR